MAFKPRRLVLDIPVAYVQHGLPHRAYDTGEFQIGPNTTSQAADSQNVFRPVRFLIADAAFVSTVGSRHSLIVITN